MGGEGRVRTGGQERVRTGGQGRVKTGCAYQPESSIAASVSAEREEECELVEAIISERGANQEGTMRQGGQRRR